jgi:uncharacterized protein DUF2092
VPEGTTIDGMLKEAVGRYGVDFPLADFLSEAPNKAFLTGVTSGRVISTVTIDGAPYDHLFFSQAPGIELELWLPKNEQSLPRRLIVTYRSLLGQPNFIAEFSDWKSAAIPSSGGSSKSGRGSGTSDRRSTFPSRSRAMYGLPLYDYDHEPASEDWASVIRLRRRFSIARQHRLGISAGWIGRRDDVED